jgi:hypothetical protein
MNLLICTPAFQFVKQKNFRKAHEEKYLYFLSLLSWNKEYRNLAAKILQSSLGKNGKFTFKTIITNLTNEGIIECDHIRIYGKKAFGYRLTEKYYTKNKVTYTLTNKKFANGVNIAALKKFDTLPEYVKQQKENLAELTINGRYVSPRLTRRSRTGRISNFLTTNKKTIRDTLLYRNTEKLVNLDFSGFHPYLLGIIVCRGLGYISMDEAMPDDLRDYLENAEQGIVYEYFFDMSGEGYADDFDKDKYKKKFYSGYFFNDKYTVINKSKAGKLFKKLYPTIHNFIIENFINKHKTLAFALQVEESNLVVNTIYKQLFEEGIWAATIHDSVVCLKKDKERVRSLMESVINKNITPCYINEVEWEGVCIHPEENTVKDINKKGEQEERLYNSVTFSKVYTPQIQDSKPVLNKNEIQKQTTRQEILLAIEQCKADNQPISALGLSKRTGINRGTITKHLNEINLQPISFPASTVEVSTPPPINEDDDWVELDDEIRVRRKDWVIECEKMRAYIQSRKVA